MIELGILDTINDNDDFRDGFCRECEAITTIPGMRGKFGEPIDPDETTCPCDFDIGDDLCIRQNDYMTVVGLVEELEDAIREVSGYVCNG